MQTRVTRSFGAVLGVLALVVGACSTGSGGTASTDAQANESTSSSAPESSATSSPTAESSTSAVPATASPTTEQPFNAFIDEVLPIIQDNCASCHTGDGSGATHMPMNTVGQIIAGSTFIATAVSDRYMPPWPASDAGLPFHSNRRLSDEQVDSIVGWAQANVESGLPDDTPVVPTRTISASIEADVTMRGEPYRGSLERPDDYRCQIYDPALDSTSYLQGLEFIGDQKPVVHHSLVFAATADARDAANAADAAEPGPGFNCTNFVNFDTGTTTLVNSWAPGQDPLSFPADTGFQMGAGDFFVVQIHYHYGSSTVDLPADQSTLMADFADEATIAAAGGSLDPLTLTVYTPPAEIPCTAGVEGPLCDRGAAMLADIETLFGADASQLGITEQQAIAYFDDNLRDCGMDPAEVATMTDGTARAWCSYPAEPGRIVSLWGHMHSLGASFRLTLNPGEPDERILLDIPKWDYAWQLLYFPTEDVTVTADDTLLIECSWDRSLDAHGAEPRYILWAEGTFDEMCYSQVVVRRS